MSWEYKVFHWVLLESALEAKMNELGAQGWEFVSAQGSTYIFKRRTP
jgi:hypothetical protein